MRYVWDAGRETWVPAEDIKPTDNVVGGSAGWPIVSDALACHAKDAAAFAEDSRKRGVPTEFKKDGRPILRDRAHRRAYLKAYGFHDRNSFTGY